MNKLRTRLITITAACGLFAGGIYVARAMPGGETRNSLAFAGTLKGTSGPQDLIFSFLKGGQPACAVKVSVTPDADGAFSVELPLDKCPSGLFDGTDVAYDVAVGNVTVARAQPVSAVPYAKYADRVGTPDCPVGYDRDPSATGIILCKKGFDEVVRVGTGASAFWIDRYEASIWQNPDGTGTQYGARGADYPATFPSNGQVQSPLFAVSRAMVRPSAYMTWFQAMEACAASGKMLPRRQEWLRAARGTPDPGASSGNDGSCVTSASGPRNTGALPNLCLSAWGAQDMIGNVWEWIDEWEAGLATASGWKTPWPDPTYGEDITDNIASSAWPGSYPGASAEVSGLPGAAVVGGNWWDGTGAGIFAYKLSDAPSSSNNSFGFRCMIPR